MGKRGGDWMCKNYNLDGFLCVFFLCAYFSVRIFPHTYISVRSRTRLGVFAPLGLCVCRVAQRGGITKPCAERTAPLFDSVR